VLVGCDHKTVAHWVAVREATGGAPPARARHRRPLADPFMEKIEELVARSRGRIRADQAHSKLVRWAMTGRSARLGGRSSRPSAVGGRGMVAARGRGSLRPGFPPKAQRARGTLEWIDRAEVLCVCGSSGIGKSHSGRAAAPPDRCLVAAGGRQVMRTRRIVDRAVWGLLNRHHGLGQDLVLSAAASPLVPTAGTSLVTASCHRRRTEII